MLRSAGGVMLALVVGATLSGIRGFAQSGSLASISVQVQTFGKARADFPATIKIHSPELDTDLSATVDKPANPVFPNLPPGAYDVQVSSAGLTPAQLDFTLSAGQSVELSLVLDHLFPLILEASHRAIVPAANVPTNEVPTPDVDTQKLDSLVALDLSKPGSSPPPDFNACSLDEVLPRVSAHAIEFVDNVNRITATEVLDLERRHRKNGRIEETLHDKVRYVANIQVVDSRYLSVDEYRDGTNGMHGFIKAVGSPALILVFHPLNRDEFEITCKGLSTWQGAPVYLLSFQQRPDRPNVMSEFRTPSGRYTVSLKGIAWVDAITFQVVHLETDLLKPVPDLFLDVEHQALDYAPVVFGTRKISLWLPQSVEISVYVGSKQFSAHHLYSNYQLFVVDTGQKVGKPKEIAN
jgi:hypothetical protein